MKKSRKLLATVIAVLMVIAAIPVNSLALPVSPDVVIKSIIGADEIQTAYIPEGEYSEFIFYPEETSTYVVVSLADDDSEIDPYIDIYDTNGDVVAYNDDSDFEETYNFFCIFEAEAYASYYLHLGEYEGREAEYDFYVTEFATIDHQPTADEPYVTITKDADDVEYQWYKSNTQYEITDDQATGREGLDGEYAYYDSDCGWVGVFTGEYYTDYHAEYNFFTVELKKGQTIAMTADENAWEFGIWNNSDEFDCSQYWYDVKAGETIYFTAAEDDVYNVYGAYEVLPWLVAESVELECLEGETEDSLSATQPGTYFCEVEFDGFRTERSHSFTIDCDHTCHSGGIMGFFWMIINFFNSIFGLNPICTCGEYHY